MTAQIKELLIFEDKKYGMATEPLKPYLELLDFNEFVAENSACWRGYYGTWEIKNNHLFLTGLHAYIKNFNEVNLQHLFPDQTEVFAYWFNGRIFLPHGKLLKYVHMGYASVYEKTLILEFENGLLISKSYLTNLNEEDEDNSRDINNDNFPF